MSTNRPPWLMLIALPLAVAVAFVWWPGCKKYPEMTSKEGMKLIKELYTACSSKSLDRLARVEQKIPQLRADGHLTADQERAFRQVVSQAKAGEWESAQEASLRMAQDQVR